MTRSLLLNYQKENCAKIIDKIMQLDFSNIEEVQELKRKLIEGINDNIRFHLEIHDDLGEFHDCEEYENRNKFGAKLLTVLNETIEEMEHEN